MADAARQRRVEERIQTTVAKMLERRIKDPRLGFVTITDCKITGDLQHATVFYTVYGTDSERRLSGKALKSATGIIRSEVGRALGIRLTPTIEFVLDALPEQAFNFEQTLAAARAADAQLADTAAQADFAGEADPYKKPRPPKEARRWDDDYDGDWDDDDADLVEWEDLEDSRSAVSTAGQDSDSDTDTPSSPSGTIDFGSTF